MTAEAFLNEVETFISKSGMAYTTFGKKVLNDPNFVKFLREGRRSPTMRTIEKVRSWMDRNQDLLKV